MRWDRGCIGMPCIASYIGIDTSIHTYTMRYTIHGYAR